MSDPKGSGFEDLVTTLEEKGLENLSPEEDRLLTLISLRQLVRNTKAIDDLPVIVKGIVEEELTEFEKKESNRTKRFVTIIGGIVAIITTLINGAFLLLS